MSMISYDTARKLFVFRQFHTEGFVNTYLQQPSADEKTIVFVSEAIENIPTGYRARETYTVLSSRRTHRAIRNCGTGQRTKYIQRRA